MFKSITAFLQPPPPIQRKSAVDIAKQYPWYRWRILSSSFCGYAMFYLIRNNLSPVAKDMGQALLYSKSQVGDIVAITAITYGFGKLFMGAISDRSDARKFLALGLILSAFCNFAFGSVQSYGLHFALWGLNGFIQGMGWGPCGRSLGHWFSMRERGITFAFWNVSHNVGGGIAGVVAAYAAGKWGWQGAFFLPGIISVIGAVLLYFTMADTPESEGLPSIEEYKNDYPEKAMLDKSELPLKTILMDHVLKNRLLWTVALANFFVYIVRYSMLDWGPTYLREMKGANLMDGGFAVMAIEFGGIPSTILVGWFSDKIGGRRGMVSLLCMIPILFAFAGILLNPPGNLWIDQTLLVIVGLFVYPPVMLLGVMALDLAGKKAVGAAAGFVGLLGYFGRTVEAKLFGWLTDTYAAQGGWNLVMYAIILSVLLSIVLLIPTWKIKPKH